MENLFVFQSGKFLNSKLLPMDKAFANIISKLIFINLEGAFLNLSEKLKQCRKKSHMTQSQVAAKLNVSRKTVSGWENDHSMPDIINIAKMSDIYHTSLDDLVRENELAHSSKTYSNQNKIFSKMHRITYLLNFFLVPLLYVELFRPYGFHLLLIPLFSIINGFAFFSSIQNWSAFKNNFYLLKLSVIFVLTFITNIFISLLDDTFLNYFHSSSIEFLFGLAMGRLLLVFLLTFCLLIIFSSKVVSKTLDA
ncbi:MAG: helix-turn-helix domain-containing protein [Liquorilactobacillus ghanensis]|uniref:helix-turn-helix domain-containing protein n=1 Tax=Liquorilactobacillus ghanensis TaxID=399370 RepID=UPI0039E7E791